jgi:Icc-related predicted phosphoesterase
MRVLFWYVEEFKYVTAIKNLESVEDIAKKKTVADAIVAFIHGEEADENNASKVETKLIKNIKWLAGKLECKRIVLHSFAHLGNSKCDPQFLIKLFDNAEKRLKDVGYETEQTPFGYFLDLDMKAPGKSLARVYKEF